MTLSMALGQTAFVLGIIGVLLAFAGTFMYSRLVQGVSVVFFIATAVFAIWAIWVQF